MSIRQSYKIWADTYDSVENKTRNLEKLALINTLKDYQFENCLEIGCGTGKNTEWLITKVKRIVCVDFSEEMLVQARSKINSAKVEFHLSDIIDEWNFSKSQFDLVAFSLVLEHVEDLDSIFQKAASALKKGGLVYIGELHPFKQYSGTKARFDTEEGQHIITCHTHNISDFTNSAKDNGLEIISINEYFDDNDRTNIPRILTLLFRKIK